MVSKAQLTLLRGHGLSLYSVTYSGFMDYMLHDSIVRANAAIAAAYQTIVEHGRGFIRVVNPPVSSSSAGISGYNVAFSGNYFYACTGNNQWGRALVSDMFSPLYCNNSSVYCNNSSIFCNATQYF